MQPVDSFRFGEISINGIRYRRDLILFPDHILEDWWRREGHLLQVEDLSPVLDLPPERLIIGTGVFGRMRVSPAVTRRLEECGISAEIVPTPRAVDLYRQNGESRLTVCALHLTC